MSKNIISITELLMLLKRAITTYWSLMYLTREIMGDSNAE